MRFKIIVYCHFLGKKNFTEVVVSVVVYMYKNIKNHFPGENQYRWKIHKCHGNCTPKKQRRVMLAIMFLGAIFGNLGTVCFDGSKGLVSKYVMI